MAIERWGEVVEVYRTGHQEKVAQAQKELVLKVGGGISADKHDGTTLSKGDRERSAFGLPKPPKVAAPAPTSRIVTARWREATIVAEDEMTALASKLNVPLDAKAMARCLCANILVRGVQRFTQVPSGSALHFYQSSTDERPDCTLVVTGPNLPCEAPGHTIKRACPDFDPTLFEDAAKERRGLLANVFWTKSETASVRANSSVLVWQKGRLDREKPLAKHAALQNVGMLLPSDKANASESQRLKQAQVLLMLVDRFQPEQIQHVITLVRLLGQLHIAPSEKLFLQSKAVAVGLPVHVDELGKNWQDLFPTLAPAESALSDEAQLTLWYQGVLNLLQALAVHEQDNTLILDAAFHVYNKTMRAA